MDEKKILNARLLAERAVADMADGPLKLKAFEVILNSQLVHPSGGDPVPTPSNDEAPSAASTTRDATSGRKQRVPHSCETRIIFLREENFFQSARSLSEIRDELRLHGWIYPLTSLSGKVQSLVQKRELRRTLVQAGKKKGYRYVAP
jgi:hypothetical protein